MADEKFKRLIREGKTAVVYSPGYGAGWYSWNSEHPGLALDGDIAQAVLDGDREQAIRIAHERYGDFYDGGGRDLEVEWVPQGSAFEITEYDGNEGVRIIELGDFMVA